MFGGSGKVEEQKNQQAISRSGEKYLCIHENASAIEFTDRMPEAFGRREICVLSQRQKTNTSCRDY